MKNSWEIYLKKKKKHSRIKVSYKNAITNQEQRIIQVEYCKKLVKSRQQ